MTKRIKKKVVRTNRVLATDRHAVAAIDPGGTSGVFCGLVELRFTMKETTLEGFVEDRSWYGQVSGNFRDQAAAISNSVRAWFAEQALSYVAPANHHVVIEDWDTMRKSPGRELISVWIAAGIDCLLTEGLNPLLKEDQITYFRAAQAKGYATDERLKLWKLYNLTRGKPHARDASRHWATKVNQIVG